MKVCITLMIMNSVYAHVYVYNAHCPLYMIVIIRSDTYPP